MVDLLPLSHIDKTSWRFKLRSNNKRPRIFPPMVISTSDIGLSCKKRRNTEFLPNNRAHNGSMGFYIVSQWSITRRRTEREALIEVLKRPWNSIALLMCTQELRIKYPGHLKTLEIYSLKSVPGITNPHTERPEVWTWGHKSGRLCEWYTTTIILICILSHTWHFIPSPLV